MELDYYLDINTNPETSPLILRDCAKAFLRGRIFSYASTKKKRTEAKQSEIEERIKWLEQQHKRSPNNTLLTSLTRARIKLDTLTTEKIDSSLRFSNQRYYENGNGASRLLALRLKKQQSSNVVYKLQPDSTVLTRPDEISQSFAQFY